MKQSILIIPIVLMLVGCGKSQYEKDQELIIEKMEWLYEANPYEDAAKAIENGDLRYWGIYGVGPVVPRLNIKCLDIDSDVMFIDGTSEALTGYKHNQLNKLAELYASEYNLQIIIYQNENEEEQCV